MSSEGTSKGEIAGSVVGGTVGALGAMGAGVVTAPVAGVIALGVLSVALIRACQRSQDDSGYNDDTRS